MYTQASLYLDSSTKTSKFVLSDLNLQSEYRSDRGDLVQDFYIPCLKNSMLYSRAVEHRIFQYFYGFSCWGIACANSIGR
jgi:hypothetical protein